NPLPNNNPAGTVTPLPPNNPGGLGTSFPNNNPTVTDGGGRASTAQVEFLGSIGKGNRFVIIADRSGSMNSQIRLLDPITKMYTERRSIDCLHEEMIKTLKNMKLGAYFYICFFDHTIDPMPFAGDSWMEGGQPLEPVVNWINGINARGGTVPLP